MIDHFLSHSNLDSANEWLRRSRKKHPANADVWSWLSRYPRNRDGFIDSFSNEKFHLLPMQSHNCEFEDRVSWCSRDAWALKALTQTLEEKNVLPISPAVSHVRRKQGSMSKEMQRIGSLARRCSFVCRTDIKGFYANIPKIKLLDWFHQFSIPTPMLRIIQQYIFYQVESNGLINTVPKGIPRATGLSNLISASLLFELDQSLSQRSALFYIRYMDDFLIFSEKRWPLKRAIKRLYQALEPWQLELHPDKTYIGRTVKGFDWLGFQWGSDGIWKGVSERSKNKSTLKRNQLVSKYGQASQRVINYDNAYLRWSEQYHSWNAQLSEKLCSFPKK